MRIIITCLRNKINWTGLYNTLMTIKKLIMHMLM